jgi:hypothetical protein
MKTLNTHLLRHSANALGYELFKRNDGLFDVYHGRPGALLSPFFTGVNRKIVAEHLLEVAIARIEQQAKYESEEAAEKAAA